MFTRFDANKSTKGASKLRRDLINAEIANLRDLLPLPPSTRQRLSQLQLMALVCVYVRKANYFQQAFKRHDIGLHPAPTPNIGFSKALSGFLMMMTQNGKLLYISDNAAEYLGHSMEDLLIHGDSVYDIIDKQDHQAIQAELGRAINTTAPTDDTRIFLCRMNVSRNARRQMRFGDQKVVLVQGHYLSFLPLCSRNEPVFLANCTPIAMPETRECVVQGATNVFTSIHTMDMRYMHLDRNGEFHLGYTRAQIQGMSWYGILHWMSVHDAASKHRLIVQSEQDRSCILLVKIQSRTGDWLWVHCVLQVKENMENSNQPVIVCTNQVLSDREASVMRSNKWLYHYYMVQSKLQYGITYDAHAPPRMVAYYQNPQPHHSPMMTPFVHHHTEINPHQSSYVHSPGSAGPVLSHQQSPQHHSSHLNGSQSHSRYAQMNVSSPQPVDYSVAHLRPPQTYMDQRYVRTPTPGPFVLSPRVSPRLSPGVVVDPVGNTGILLMPPVSIPTMSMQHHLNRHGRMVVKAATSVQDPADFIDQWNPSPPWSDTLQKVPDITHQDLSPYITTTPPTPTSTPGVPAVQISQQAFTFDWVPEQFVPNITNVSRNCQPVDENHYYYMSPSTWSDHRMFPLQPPPTTNKAAAVQNPERSSPVKNEDEPEHSQSQGSIETIDQTDQLKEESSQNERTDQQDNSGRGRYNYSRNRQFYSSLRCKSRNSSRSDSGSV